MKKLFIIAIICMAFSSEYIYSQNIDTQSLSIEKLFAFADSNNLSIKAYSQASEVAQATVKVSKNAWFPSIDASLSLGYNGNGIITDRNFSNPITAEIPSFGNNFSVEVSQVIFSGGAILQNVKLSEINAELAKLDAENNRQKIRFLLVGNWLEMCKLQNQIVVFEAHIKQTEQLLNNMSSQFEEGTAIQNDITRYELQLQNLNYSKIQLQNSLLIINNQLVKYLGLPTGTIIRPDTNDLFTEGFINSANDWQNAAMLSSFELQIAEKKVQMCEYKEKLAHADRYPQIGFFAGDNLNGPITIEIPAIDKNFNYWYFGLGIRYKLDNLYKSGREIKVNQLSLQHAHAQQSVVEENTLLAMDEAFIRYQESFTLLETKQISVKLALQNWEVIRYRYENDLALITDLLDASSQKLDAELQEVNAKINTIYHYYKLKYIAGKL